MATLCVFSGPGPLGPSANSSWWFAPHGLGNVLLPSFLSCLFCSFSPECTTSSNTAVYIFCAPVLMPPWKQAGGDMHAPPADVHSAAASYFCGDAKAAAERNPVIRRYITPDINNYPLVLLNAGVQTRVTYECHHTPFSLPVSSPLLTEPAFHLSLYGIFLKVVHPNCSFRSFCYPAGHKHVTCDCANNHP